MLTTYKQQNLRFQGFLNTPNLWKHISLFNLEQLQLPPSGTSFTQEFKTHLRLGKLVERFVIHEIQNNSSLKLLLDNYQVQDGKQTIGELDCLLLADKQPLHIEVVYKFYLYDPSIGTSEIDHWIGPNRRDSLVKKLTKLKEKQLPLLHHTLTKNHLKALGFDAQTFKQHVCFKAQLFLPYRTNPIDITPLNSECIQGIYINRDQVHEFKQCKFFIPQKLDWLMDIPTHIDWLDFESFNTNLLAFLEQQSSPLCWIKYPNGETLKCFVVWW